MVSEQHRIRSSTWCADAHTHACRFRILADYKVPAYKEPSMLQTIAIILLIMWALGMVTSYTVGGFIHILLVIAIVMILIRVIQGRSPL
jgi:hypothetical protein